MNVIMTAPRLAAEAVAVIEAAGDAAAKDLPKMKKAEACAAAAAKLLDTRWLPTPLRGHAAKTTPAVA